MGLLVNIVAILIIIGIAALIIFHNIKKSGTNQCPIGKDCNCQIKKSIK